MLKGDLERDGSFWIEGRRLAGVMIAGVLRTREETVAKGRQKTQSSMYTQYGWIVTYLTMGRLGGSVR